MSDTEQVKAAARAMMDVFEDALDLHRALHRHRRGRTRDNRERLTEAIVWMQAINSARVALNSTRTAANRIKFLDEAASWPTGLNGDVRGRLRITWTRMTTAIAVPTKDWSWVNPETDPPVAQRDESTWRRPKGSVAPPTLRTRSPHQR